MSIDYRHIKKYSSFIKNNNYSFSREKILNVLDKEAIDKAYNTISNWETYTPVSYTHLTLPTIFAV